MELDIQAIEAFVKCAKRGRPGGSSGEVTARKLAGKVSDLSRLMQDMDFDKQKGFCDALLAAAWPDSRDAILKMIK